MRNIHIFFILFIFYNTTTYAQGDSDARRNQTWLLGGVVETSNWYFYSHVATPLIIGANGSVSFVIDFQPKEKDPKK